ncbi:BREX-1 system adenine-specific DNA-methyltransferase PglX [Priestia flexa]|uniref:BREX-1 system adenine-specific DNA-methyltransferase PglX n=1 Tax=Priestia flexa TaxID=86664 RepID=UPI000C2456EB|nr:BREX-1 system adenine-specific DNA-methyltransferase PglX [Priestia flexa]MEC0666132.1 BREX-1 system adenine-specific DNA-methyltransferase PglX [Priestia flexa]
MKPEQKKAINRTILKCREILEKDIENRLVTYGILMDEPWIEKDKLSLSDEQEQVYKDLRDAIAKEMKGGLSEKEALISYIREVTYTYLNRIAALRVMEVRGLMEEVLVQKEEYSNRSYGHRNFFEIAREFCKSQSDEGLSYFISLIFKEVSADIGLLFNIDDEYSIIGPSNHALVEIIRLLTTDIDVESWQQDEIIGWIYQYFNEEEKKEAYRRVNKEKHRFTQVDIPAATQLFTPDWIVEWITNNSLGKLREEIVCGEREFKKIEEIKFLDPACGSGHFLVKAYDLFYQYYVEDGYSKEDIPLLILKNNLYGIDIDARAVQLTALILYIKVRVSLKEIGVQELTNNITVNLVCADAVLLNGERLATMKKQFENNPTVLSMIEIIYDEFTDTRLKGSLIQPEKRLIPLIEEYKQIKQKNLSKKSKKEELGLFEGMEEFNKEQENSVLTKSERELFGYLEQIYIQATKANDLNNLLFANEAKKSIQLLNLFLQKYDVVVANPPYMGFGNMGDELKQFVTKNYTNYNNDLYSVFIVRLFDFLDKDAYLGMVTQESFMYIQSYEKLRSFIIENSFIYKFAHLGKRAFDDIGGEIVSTAMFVLRKNPSITGISQFLKLDHFKDSQTKFENLSNKNIVKDVDQKYFLSLEKFPFLYNIPLELQEIIKTHKPFGENFGEVKKGITTGNVNAFIKYWWEVSEYQNGEHNYIPYVKGGKSEKFWSDLNQIVDWRLDDMKKEKGFSLKNQQYFFKEGLNFSVVGSKSVGVRFLPEGFIFDASNSFILIKENWDKYYLLGILASDLVDYLIKVFNPTINITQNDIHRVPIIYNNVIETEIVNLVKDIIKLKKSLLSFNDNSKLFEFSMYLNELNNQSLSQIVYSKFKLQKELSLKIKKLNDLIFDVYKISDKTKKEIYSELNTRKKIKYIKPPKNKEEWEKVFLGNENQVDPLIYSENVLEYNTMPEKHLNEQLVILFNLYFGLIFGRWNVPEIDVNEGILQINNSLLEERIYDCIDITVGEENFEIFLEKEIPIIMKKDLLKWLLEDYFEEHSSLYENRPIYWHICSPNKTFNALLYYHALTSDTLYKLKSSHLKPMLQNTQEDLNFYREKMSSAVDKKLTKQFEKRVTELEKQVNDIEAFDKQIDEIIASGYKPDINKGVLYNIKPLNPILAKKIEK